MKTIWILLAIAFCAAGALVGCQMAVRDVAPHGVTRDSDVPSGIVPPAARVQTSTPASQPSDLLALLPSPAEELWVISKPPQDPVVPHSDHPLPGEGRLLALRKDAGGQKLIPVPLKHTDVKASIIGYIATVDVQQQYHNPYNDKIEAVYVFPLPQNAAVNEFVMTIGPRRIRAIIRERREAEQIYREAKSQGYVASLLTQERPNVFTQAVANIEPAKRIDIDIKYFNTLDYRDGYYEFVFPMVVGPRFNPPGYGDGIGAVARGAHGTSRQRNEVQYLRPDERSGHDIALSVSIDAGVPIENLDSRNHKVSVRKVAAEKIDVNLDPSDRIPNRDFVLRYQVAGKTTKSSLIAQRNGSGGYFTLMLFPPATLREISHPALSDITIDWGGAKVHDVFPAQPPDLYVGRPVILTGRFEGELPRSVLLHGTLGGHEQQVEIPVEQADAKSDARALPAVWARMKIADLADRAAYEGGVDLPAQVRQLAIEYNLMSAYTAFVAVDSMTRTSGDHGITVDVPVPVPEGVRYDTTVQEAGGVRQAEPGVTRKPDAE